MTTIGEQPRHIQGNLGHQEQRRILQPLPHMGGVERETDELRQALAGTWCLVGLSLCGSYRLEHIFRATFKDSYSLHTRICG